MASLRRERNAPRPGRAPRTMCTARAPCAHGISASTVRSFARGTGRPRRWRCMARSERDRHGPTRRTSCSSRRLSVRHTAVAPPPGAFRGMARTWFPPRREGACRSECTGRPRSAPSGAACSWPGRCAAWPPRWPRRISARLPCRPRISRGPRRGAAPGTARRMNAVPRRAPCRSACKCPRPGARPARGGSVRVRTRARGPGLAAAFPGRAASHHGRGSRGCASRRMNRRPSARAPAEPCRSAGTGQRPCGRQCVCGTVRGRRRGQPRDRRKPWQTSLGAGSEWADARPSRGRPVVRGAGRQPRCLRSQNRPVATLPHACRPPRGPQSAHRRAHRHRPVVLGVVQSRQGAEGRAEMTPAGGRARGAGQRER